MMLSSAPKPGRTDSDAKTAYCREIRLILILNRDNKTLRERNLVDYIETHKGTPSYDYVRKYGVRSAAIMRLEEDKGLAHKI